MQNPTFTEHWNDTDGNPGGGTSWGHGFAISWQNGPLGRCECTKTRYIWPGADHGNACRRNAPNGAFVEDIIAVAMGRIAYYQDSRFACSENADALFLLRLALQTLNGRTSRREAAAVEGTHEGA